jgi:hypothetical protein
MLSPKAASELGVARRSREWDDVLDVGHTGSHHDQPLETEAEAAVRHAAVLAEITVPPVVLDG